jgi:hypothetical protein
MSDESYSPLKNLKKGDTITLVCLEDGAGLSLEYQKFDVTVENNIDLQQDVNL